MITPDTEPAATKYLAGRREWIGLAVLALPLLLVSMDVSVLYFAVPFISADLGATATQQLWIFDIYGFVLAGLLLPMGSLGDRIGRRRLLVAGAAAFGFASLAAAYARSPQELIAARALLGIGGATLMPSTLALIRNMFPDPGQRSKAIAAWSAVLMGGVSLGPVLSGLLLEHFWWGSVFAMNIPFMVLLLVLAPVLVPEFRPDTPGRFDLLSSVLSLAAVLPFIFGIKSAAADGWRPVSIAAIGVGLLMGAIFLRRQQRRPDPMIELAPFADRRFSGGLAANLVAMFALVGNAVFLTQYLQLVLSMSPFRAALWSLVPSVGVAAAAPAAQALGRRYDPAYVLSGGFLLGASGFAALTRVRPTSSLAVLLVGAGLVSMGLVAVMTLVTEFVVGTVPADRAGSAAALMETGSELGGSLGIAVLGSIGAMAFRATLGAHLPAGLPAQFHGVVNDGLPGAVAASQQLPDPLAGQLLSAARGAFSTGLNTVALVGAGILLVAAGAATRLVGPAAPGRDPRPEAVGTDELSPLASS